MIDNAQSFQRIRNIFNRRKKLPTDPSDLEPVQYLRELNDRLTRNSSDRDLSPAQMRTRFGVAKNVAKLVKPIMYNEKWFDPELRIGIELLTSQSMTSDFVWAAQPAQKYLTKYLNGIIESVDRKEKPLVWLEWCISTELIYAFDAQPFCTEGLVVLLRFLGSGLHNERMIDVGEQAGSPSEYCSASKNAVGSYLAGQLPDPACIVTSSNPCDSIVSSYQELEYLSGAPIYRLDTPYYDDERALDRYSEDIKGLIAFLEKQLGRKLDYDRLRDVLTEVNQTNELLMEINEMYRARPCPGSLFMLLLNWFFKIFGLGVPEITESTRRLHQVVKQRYEAGIGAIKEEKIRVIWFDVPVVFYPLLTWMEEKFGAVIVADLVGYLNTTPIDTSSEESMIRGLARQYLDLPMGRQLHGPLDLYKRDLTRVCDEYSGDCFIMAGHVGCKHIWASTRHLKEYMKKIDMPLLILASDIFDQRVSNEPQLKAQVEDFFMSNGLV